jgi:hypothetical protein
VKARSTFKAPKAVFEGVGMIDVPSIIADSKDESITYIPSVATL